MQNYMEIDAVTGEKSYGALPLGHPLPEGAIAVDKQPSEAFTSHCPNTCELVVDHRTKADAVAGPEAVAYAHAQKTIEALLYQSGVKLEGLIAAEAKTLGICHDELAETILSHAQSSIAVEVARRVAKTTGTE